MDRFWKVCLFIVFVMVASLTINKVFAQVVVEAENFPAALHVPKGWSVVAFPKGFNIMPYDEFDNPYGKLKGRWPLYDQLEKESGCVKEGEIDFSPSTPCPPRPEFVVKEGCYFPEVQEEPNCGIDFSPVDPRCFGL